LSHHHHDDRRSTHHLSIKMIDGGEQSLSQLIS
jgi:hypothetical protein